MTVLIGKGRRLTLTELSAVAFLGEPLELATPSTETPLNKNNTDDDGVGTQLFASWHLRDEATATSATAPISTTVTTSVPETLAILTVLALHVAQPGRFFSTPSEAHVAAERLVGTVSALQQSSTAIARTLPRDTDACVAVLAAFLAVGVTTTTTAGSSSSRQGNPRTDPALDITHAVARCVTLALDGLATHGAVRLAAVSVPVAALTVDARGMATVVLDAAAELHYDVLRPHRAMSAAAALLRALLNASKYETHRDDDDNDDAVYTNIPQYVGPAGATLQAVAQTMELELNGMAATPATVLDSTVQDLARAQAARAVQVLWETSQARQATPVPTGPSPTLSLTSYTDLVATLQLSLEREVEWACARIHQVTAQAEVDARTKESTPTITTAAPTDAPRTDDDEFAGLTTAQKAKILKKRAEKEAKAAAKRMAKEKKGVALFGAGTVPLLEILRTGVQDAAPIQLTPDRCQAVSELCDKLLSGGVQRKPKIAKGTRDYLPEQMMIRQEAFNIIRRVFESHGAVEIDTPVFELKDTLTGKYGEDSKLIYDLADQGGELLALRYDLTVPFARFLSLNSVGNIKRFHIGKVYRRDQPQLNRGRYREFYQCDFDIAGTYGRMVPDSECLCVACDILDALPIGDFGIKLNHRRLLDAILDLCGVPADKFRTICSAVDKLDKEAWSEVKREMVEDKGLPESVADKIGTFVLNKGPPWDMYKSLMDGNRFGNHKGANEAMEDLRILFEYLEAMDKLKFISFDLSLARGLDYYTGVIYEAVCMSGEAQVGSIGGGGRYDNLVSMFQEAGKQTPCVGVSVGIERVFTLMEARLREQQGGSIKRANVNILIAAAGGTMMKEKMRIARILWDNKLSAEFSQQENAKLKKELQNALDRDIPFMVIVGEEELAESKVTVKDLKAKTEHKVPIDELVSTLRAKGVIPVGCEFAAEIMQL
jgi:histidyl-tRNA synthetase